MIIERVETCTSEEILVDGTPFDKFSFPEKKSIVSKAINLITDEYDLYSMISRIIDSGDYESSGETCDCCGDETWNRSWIELKEEECNG